MRNTPRILLYFALIFFIGGTGYTTVQLNALGQSQSDAVAEAQAEIWHLVQVGVQLQQTLASASRLAANDSNITQQDLSNRFDLLWSRVDNILNGPTYARLRAVPDINGLLLQLHSELEKADGIIQYLRPGDNATMLVLVQQLTPYVPRLNQAASYFFRGMSPAKAEYAIEGQQINTQARYGIIVMVLGGLLLMGIAVRSMARYHDTLQLVRQAQAPRDAGNRAKRAFLSNLSLEIRDPLNTILGCSSMLHHEIHGPIHPAAYKSIAQDIEFSGQSLLTFLNDVIAMADAETGALDLNESQHTLDSIVDDAMSAVQAHGKVQEVSVVRNLPTNLPSATIDKQRITQVLTTLLVRAIETSDASGVVAIMGRSEPNGGYSLSVIDHGKGMSANDISHALTPFEKLVRTPDTPVGEQGLSLPLARSLMDRHNGQLSLESVLGEGTTARISLPSERIQFI